MGGAGSDEVIVTAKEPVKPSPQAEAIAQMLSTLGYAVSSTGRNTINVADKVDNKVVNTVLLVSEDGTDVFISCHVGNLNDIPDDQVLVQRDFLFTLVNMNDVISPFATSLITPQDDKTVGDNVNIVLVNRFNIGIHSHVQDDLAYQMNSLRKAIMTYNQQVAIILPNA